MLHGLSHALYTIYRRNTNINSGSLVRRHKRMTTNMDIHLKRINRPVGVEFVEKGRRWRRAVDDAYWLPHSPGRGFAPGNGGGGGFVGSFTEADIDEMCDEKCGEGRLTVNPKRKFNRII